jgi:putative addiction module killer protein
MYPKEYTELEVRQTETFRRWWNSIPERKTRFRIDARLRRLSLGHLGDSKSVGGGVWELRLNFGPGYRIYFYKLAAMIVVLLAGGTKSTQDRDMDKARRLLHDLEV